MKEKICNFLNNSKFYLWIKQREILTLFFINLCLNFVFSAIPCIQNNKFPNAIEDLSFLFLKIFAFSIILFLIFFAIKKIGKILIYIFTATNCFIFLMNAFIFVYYKSLFSQQMIDHIVHTNLNEALEFVIFFFNYKILIFLILFFGVIFIALKSSQVKSSQVKSSQNSAKFFNILVLICIIASSQAFYKKDFFKKNEHFLLTNFSSHIYEYFYVNQNNALEITKKLLKIQNKEANLTANNKIKNIVLIIGESAARRHHQLYESIYKNNPNILSLSQNSVVFKDVVAPRASTNMVMKELLFFNRNKNFKKNLNIISLYNLANYNTFWISNQDIGIYGSIASSVANLSKNKFYSNTRHFSRLIKENDEILLKPLIEFKNKTKNNNFFVVHLMGSHLIYKDRYPKKFDIFKSSDINETRLSRKQKLVKATYLNSIAYTDFVISEIYKIFKNDEALIIYLSDHADSVYDFENFIGHARDLKSVLEIPFIVFATPKFQEKYPQIWKKIKEVKDLPWVSNGLADFLSDISDINSTWKNPKKSIINAEFNPKLKRMVGKPRADFKTLK